MKTLQSTNHKTFSIPEVEDYMQRFSKIEFEKIQIQAKNEGSKNQPGSSLDFNIRVIQPLISSLDKAIAHVSSHFQPVSNMAIMQTQRKVTSEEVSHLEEEKTELEKKLITLKHEVGERKNQVRPSTNKNLKVLVPFLAAIVEGLFAYNLISSAGYSLDTRILVTFVIMATVGIGIQGSANYISNGVDKAEKSKRLKYVIAVGVIATLLLGIWRTILYSQINDTQSKLGQLANSQGSNMAYIIPLMIISGLIFFISLHLALRNWVSNEDKNTEYQYISKEEEIYKLESEITRIEDEIAKKKKQILIDSETAIRSHEYRAICENRLKALFPFLKDHYEKVNITYRKDKMIPAFFGQKIIYESKTDFVNPFANNPNSEK